MKVFSVLALIAILFTGCKTSEIQGGPVDQEAPVSEDITEGGAMELPSGSNELNGEFEENKIPDVQKEPDTSEEILPPESPDVPDLKVPKHESPLKGELKSPKPEPSPIPESAPVEETLQEPAPALPMDSEHREEDRPAPVPSEAADPDSEEIIELPSELESLPLNPLLEQSEQSETDAPEEAEPSPDWPGLTEPVTDKEEQLAAPEPQGSAPKMETQEEASLDDGVYTIGLDHMNRLVISLDGAGWIFLSFRPADDSPLQLLDKRYDPASKTTNFIFRLDGEPRDQNIVIMKQDLSSGESDRYVLEIKKDAMMPQEDPQQPSIVENPNIAPSSPEFGGEGREERDPSLSEEESADALENPIIPDSINNLEESSSDMEDLDYLSADELLRMAESYEEPGPGQSLEKAREYYLFLLDKYPVSLERFQAEERIRYLDRHYFKVQ